MTSKPLVWIVNRYLHDMGLYKEDLTGIYVYTTYDPESWLIPLSVAIDPSWCTSSSVPIVEVTGPTIINYICLSWDSSLT